MVLKSMKSSMKTPTFRFGFIDPKLSWALRHPEQFPVDLNRADYRMILRVPGIGVKSAKKIVQARRFGKIHTDLLKQLGVAYSRAQFFIRCEDSPRFQRNFLRLIFVSKY